MKYETYRVHDASIININKAYKMLQEENASFKLISTQMIVFNNDVSAYITFSTDEE